MPGHSSVESNSKLPLCPFCQEPIQASAKKCRHCGEFVDDKSRKQRQRARWVAALGFVTAALSLFYPLREGYFYIQKQQQVRAELDSYKAVASKFEAANSLSYAQQALSKALDLAPNDIELQRRLFVLRAQDLLREIEWNGATDQQQPVIEAMILDGHRLLQSTMSGAVRAQLQVMLARLLPQDRLWNDNNDVTTLFAQAYQQQPKDPEVLFRYGQWLVDAELDNRQGLKLIAQAVQLAPNDALYPYEQAKILQDQDEFGQALPLLRKAINLLPKQRELQRVRASNFSKAELRKLLVKANEAQDISSGEFFGLDVSERQKLIEQVLELRANDRTLNFIAARFYFANNLLQLAESAISKVATDDDLRQVRRGYYLEQFELYSNILQRTGSQPDKLQSIQQALEEHQQALTYEEALELGIEGGHRYKIGLRLAKQSAEQGTEQNQKGLKIIKTYSGYPFAKSGAQAGDWILQIAHRKPQSIMAIYNILANFEAGATVPILLERDNQKVELVLTVE